MALALAATQGQAQTQPRIWNIKAVLPTGHTLAIKAFDAEGKPHDVKALENGDTHLMDVKALVGDQQLPIKVIASDDAFAPVKAIGADGRLWDVKAIDAEGNKLDVKGVSRAGRIIHIKALGPQREIYGVKAISPDGLMRDVKGVKMNDDPVEATINGVKVSAHVKAVVHATDGDGDPIWNVKCVQPDGQTLDIKALDKDGGVHDVKAFEENSNTTFLDIKALINGDKVAVKILVTGDERSPVKAIGADGTIYDIKALTPEGKRLDVKGVGRSGNIYHIKVISENGDRMAVKAISPHGLFYDVKGLKFSSEDEEMRLNGVAVRAHVKALPQVE
jgi:hypothetical protein